jgi:hypothetical protein
LLAMVFSAVLFDSRPVRAVAKDGMVPPGRSAAVLVDRFVVTAVQL